MPTAADIVLIVHAAFVVFVVGGLIAIWVGLAMNWRYARSRWLRILHLAAIAFVVAESLLGIACPLTEWEAALRGEGRHPEFIQRYVHAVLFWRAPPWVFTSAYVAFGALVAATWWRWPPRR
ncbi:MAG: DUF2784 domain-containing protein [Usitatibacter sp.]